MTKPRGSLNLLPRMSSKTFSTVKTVRIQHCDPAGVVFTPQYFNLFIEVLEDWFADALDYPFATMISKNYTGIPAMHIDAKFHSPSKLGDMLHFSLVVEKIRKSTVLLRITANSPESQKRCSMKMLYGFAEFKTTGLSAWPANLREKMEEYLK